MWLGLRSQASDSQRESIMDVLGLVEADFAFFRPIALLIATAQLGVAPQYIGLVSGLLISARSVGGAIGVASKNI